MKKYTLTLNKPFDEDMAATLKDNGILCEFSSASNLYVLFVQAKDRAVLENLDFVAKVRPSHSYRLHI